MEKIPDSHFQLFQHCPQSQKQENLTTRCGNPAPPQQPPQQTQYGEIGEFFASSFSSLSSLFSPLALLNDPHNPGDNFLFAVVSGVSPPPTVPKFDHEIDELIFIRDQMVKLGFGLKAN